jgi:hypothetical protein
MSSTDKYLNVVEDVDPLESLTGKLVWGRLANGRTFVSRLVKVDRSKLYFRTKTGLIIMNDLRKITELREHVQTRGAV